MKFLIGLAIVVLAISGDTMAKYYCPTATATDVDNLMSSDDSFDVLSTRAKKMNAVHYFAAAIIHPHNHEPQAITNQVAKRFGADIVCSLKNGCSGNQWNGSQGGRIDHVFVDCLNAMCEFFHTNKPTVGDEQGTSKNEKGEGTSGGTETKKH